jgi:hypothetical protein
LRSRTEKKEVWGGIWEGRVYGLRTTWWIGLMAALPFLRSWTNLKEPLGFFNWEDGSVVRGVNRDEEMRGF